MAVVERMSESARGGVLVVGGSESERERWQMALVDLVSTDAVADGTEALACIDDGVEVLVVHRGLADQAASELVATVRDREFTVRAALLSPERPEGDVVAQGFDAWLQTPVEADLLVRTVEGLLACRRYDRAVGDLYELASEHAGPEADTLAVRERIHEARAEADAALAAVETIDREALLANSPAAFSEGGQ